jgi:hypothetical protein
LLSGGENYCPSYAEYGFVLLNSSEGINMPPNDLPTGYDFSSLNTCISLNERHSLVS